MNLTTQPDLAENSPFSFPQLATPAPDETLLFDAGRYERHKKAQLFRPPAVAAAADARLALEEGQIPEAMAARRSHRRFAPEPVAWTALGAALGALRHFPAGEGIRALYPSTGGLYGLDFYLHVKTGRVEGLPGAIYYYHPATHRLHRAGPEEALGKDIHHHNNRPVFANSAFTLIIVFDSATTAPVYGRSSVPLAAIEAGLALGAFIQLAEASQIGICPIGLVDFAAVSRALGLKPGQAVLHLAECGRKPATADETAAAAPDLSISGLRQFLAATLPDYMVPSQFVLIDEIPLTPNNKVDRDALLKMEGGAPLDLGTRFVAAESDFESRLQEIWRRVLKRDLIGVEDNFFDLGGDSVGVAEVHAHILQEWKLEVPIVKLFQFPTIRAAASFLRAQAAGPAASQVPGAAPLAADRQGELASADRAALDWIRAHPDDPRAAAIAAKLRSRNVPA